MKRRLCCLALSMLIPVLGSASGAQPPGESQGAASRYVVDTSWPQKPAGFTWEAMPGVTVDSYTGMTVDYVRSVGANVILRGIRTISDFEYEFQMALTNRHFADDMETIFMMTSNEYSFLSSHFIKEAVALGGDVSAFVPPLVEEHLKKKLTKRSR